MSTHPDSTSACLDSQLPAGAMSPVPYTTEKLLSASWDELSKVILVMIIMTNTNMGSYNYI
jgi:hypothetical protein